ncbi:ABC transporter permease [Verrucomicrobiaceae bacterium R5-34]|uniref:ABC transporter permease n=1 Tax=Oceaniferula flava TaxID=2800421 RepID=A0AAE2S987_9BACT|nr:ABC transporter permease [Oceaniferula flavus]MBK1829249.1 ABC transporter permease [Verrucomicrobiaceae bacterium R5-34]MBK1853486.1 ABC transporter permease [Oceaniferula flavus]MBM1134791.1 ABC transporter permease [Oceaniferula flavus]
MKAYFIRRFLLVPLTLLGVTVIVFALTRFMPGSPMERAMQRAAQAEDNSKSSGSENQGGLSDEQLEELEEEYGYDKSIPVAYMQWLGLIPRERYISKSDIMAREEDTIGASAISDPENETLVVLKGSGRQVKVNKERPEEAVFVDTGEMVADSKWTVRIDSPEERAKRWLRRNGGELSDAPVTPYRAVLYKKRFSGLLQGDLGRSSTFQDKVSDMILARVPIAVYFGLLSTIIIYSICIPLGIVKAIKHRTFLDNATSVMVFVGYSIPGFALGAILLVYLGARMGWFPLFGLMSPDAEELSFWGKVKDLGHHTVLPLSCYIVGGFAYTTMMMKNNLMDNLAADYVRTAVAKGVSFRRAVFKHAFRNSFIPIATSLGGLITIFVGGSMLVETVFDIQGFGLLQFQAIMNRDQSVIMGTLTIAAFLMIVGNILSDIIVAMIDPRIKFH